MLNHRFFILLFCIVCILDMPLSAYANSVVDIMVEDEFEDEEPSNLSISSSTNTDNYRAWDIWSDINVQEGVKLNFSHHQPSRYDFNSAFLAANTSLGLRLLSSNDFSYSLNVEASWQPLGVDFTKWSTSVKKDFDGWSFSLAPVLSRVSLFDEGGSSTSSAMGLGVAAEVGFSIFDSGYFSLAYENHQYIDQLSYLENENISFHPRAYETAYGLASQIYRLYSEFYFSSFSFHLSSELWQGELNREFMLSSEAGACYNMRINNQVGLDFAITQGASIDADYAAFYWTSFSTALRLEWSQ